MTLQEIFDQLTYGELSQLSIGGGEAGVINSVNYVRVVPHVNLALIALYKRFSLKEGRLTLTPVIDQTLYSIHSDEVGGYLLDTEELPFTDDILKIEHVLTDDGVDIPLNDAAHKYSITTPTSTLLRIPLDIVNQVQDLPDWLKTTKLELLYRANHPKIGKVTNPKQIDIELPYTHLEPLLLFIAARMMTPLGVGQFEGLAGNNYMAKYEMACQFLETKGLQIDQGSQTSRLRDKGWA